MNNSSSQKTDLHSLISTNCNDNLTEDNLQKPKFQKKNPEENYMKKQRSRLSLINSKGSTSMEPKSETTTPSLKKSEFNRSNPIYRYQIFYFSKSMETIYEVFIYLQNTITVKETIDASIKSLNDKFLKEEIPMLLKEDENCFDLYLSKKNGCAKKDLPSLDFFQILSMTHIKTFTLCEKNIGAVINLRKSNKVSSILSPDSNLHNENLSVNESIANKSSSIIIAKKSYMNSLFYVKCKSDKEEGFFEDCQKQMFCGVFKLFGKSSPMKIKEDQITKQILCKS